MPRRSRIPSDAEPGAHEPDGGDAGATTTASDTVLSAVRYGQRPAWHTNTIASMMSDLGSR